MDQRAILERIRKWAQADENIRLVVVTGSVAQGGSVSDALSDLDVELYAVNPTSLLETSEWYGHFGDVLVVEALQNPEWHPTRLVYYVDGKIDFMVADLETVRRGITYTRPYQVVLDKDGLSDHLRLSVEEPSPPTKDDFATCINWFYAAALMCAKCIVRQEPWMAKARDCDLKEQLLRMIEWDHKSRYGWTYDTWYMGKNMQRWMDGDVQESVKTCWADFSIDRMAPALSASVELFERVSRRTAIALGMDVFPRDTVRQEIDRVLSLRPR